MSTNKPELDSTYRVPIRTARRQFPAERSAKPVVHQPERIIVAPPTAYLNVDVDGRESSFFEWLGAGLYSADRHSSTQNGQSHVLHELHYGFGEHFFYMRVDAFPEFLPKLQDCEFRIMVCGRDELRLMILIEQGRLVGWLLDAEDVCILGPHELVEAAFEKILEVAIGRRLFTLAGQTSLALKVELWQCGLAVDSLPVEICVEVKLGTDAFAWPAQ
jgi:hypothetical protein